MTLPIEKILISKDQIHQKVRDLAKNISRDYKSEPVVLISVLKGSIVFLVDLMREMALDVEIGFMYLSSYQGETSPQTEIRHISLPCPELGDRHVILVEDILDTGASLDYAYRWCAEHKPKSLKTCVFLIKDEIERPNIPIHYHGFHIPNEFVVGYGLDYQERYRHLPYIAVPHLGESS
ncbi:hypoxanthine phosphoribosyltransferase [bacterium]|nr:hypoxanthine phosphoribosyltransferase [bacterium]